jgi:hypothetical protein
MRRSLLAAGLLVVVGLLAFGTSAVAKGPPVVNQTDHLVNETSTQIDVHPCTGVPVELTLVETGVIHFSAFADGTVHFTGTLLEEGGAVGKGQGASTLNGRGVNADGSTFRFHQNGNTVFDENGVPRLDFFKSRCR